MRRVGLIIGLLVVLSSPPVAASQDTHCPPGLEPHYVHGFLALSEMLGSLMGVPVTCEHADPRGTGDVHQITSGGLAYWRNATNTPTFTNGWDHWAITETGLVYWAGESIDPIPEAVAVEPPAPQVPPPPARGPPEPLIVAYFDVGQGDATLLQGPDFTILIDAGRHDRNDVVPHLQAVGVQSIDLLVGTHPHADHIGQFPQVLDTFPVGEVWLSGNPHTTLTFERAIDAIERSDAGYHEPRAGEVVTIGSARVEVVNPDHLTGDLHEGSIGLRIVYGDVAFVFTGDAESPTERAMITRGHELHAQVLQLGHHGSRTSSTLEFLQAAAPEVVIYSAGEGNVYGHPHPEPLARLAELGIPVYGTDVNGTIRVVTDGTGYTVQPTRGEAIRAPPEPIAPPPAEPEPDPVPGACLPGQVDINTAPRDELLGIIHIGEMRADELIALRPFGSLDDLARISGIGAARVGDIKEQGLACVS